MKKQVFEVVFMASKESVKNMVIDSVRSHSEWKQEGLFYNTIYLE